MPLTTEQLSSLDHLHLAHAPVAVSFLPTPPSGLPRVSRADAAGCGYWQQASEGRAFYTLPEDHANCPVGAYTHGVALSAEQGQALQGLIGTMVELKYLRPEEVPGIPHRADAMQVAAYAPLPHASFAPDVVVFRGTVRQIMVLSEAARAAGVFETAAVMGRPACAMIPQAAASGAGVASVGCIGNRVYTGLGDGEMYLTVPGAKVAAVLQELDAIAKANDALEQFHTQRAVQLRPV
jgi:uncharacterized protein (DUF169 family)